MGGLTGLKFQQMQAGQIPMHTVVRVCIGDLFAEACSVAATSVVLVLETVESWEAWMVMEQSSGTGTPLTANASGVNRVKAASKPSVGDIH